MGQSFPLPHDLRGMGVKMGKEEQSDDGEVGGV